MGWFSPTYKMLTDDWRMFTDRLHPITARRSEQEHRLDLVTGGSLEMWGLDNPDGPRGRKYSGVVINEAAMVPRLLYVWNSVIRPTLVDMAGGAIMASTPRGMNEFHSLEMSAGDNPDWSIHHYSSYANPHISGNELDNLKATMTERYFRQEILAEYVDMEGGVFRRIHEAAVLEPLSAPVTGNQYVMGADIATAADFTVICVLDVADKSLVYMDRFNRVDYPVLEDRLLSTYNRFGCTSASIEANGIGQGVIDHLYNSGMSIRPFTTTNATKDAIIRNLQSAFEHGEIKILNDTVLVGELLSFEARRNASGSFSYSAPEGLHDDCVMALAIAWDAIGSGNWYMTGI